MGSGLLVRVGRVLRGLGALALLVGLVAGVPWALWHFVGWPLPHHVPTVAQVGRALNHQGIPAQALVDALAVVVWLTWAVLVASVAAEIPPALSGRRAARLPFAWAVQPLTGRLVASVVVACLALAPRTGNPGAPGPSGGGLVPAALHRPVATLVFTGTDLTGASRPVAGTVASTPTPASTAPSAAVPAATSTQTGPLRTYVVQRGDTLWGIAERELGDPLQWQAIYQLNEGRPQPGDVALTDPHWIDPGWTLLLPAPATPPSATPPTDPASIQPGPSMPSSPASDSPPATAIPPPTTTPVTPAPATSVPHTNGGISNGGAPDGLPVRLPSGSVIAGSFAAGVLSAMAAARLRRRRAYRPGLPRPGVGLAAPAHPTGLSDLLVTVGADRRDRDDDLSCAPVADRAPLGVVPDDEAIARPDLIDVGYRGDEAVSLALGDWPGLRLSGPGAEPALRAWLATLVTRDGPYAAEILVAGDALLERLLPDVRLPSVHQLETVDSVLSWLESAAVGRARRLDEADVSDANAYRCQCPADPFPLLLALVDDVPNAAQNRWSAAMTAAHRVGVAAVVLYDRSAGGLPPGPGGPRLVVAEDGIVEQASLAVLADALVGARLFQLDGATAADLLRPVAAVHNDIDPEPFPSAAGPSDTGGDAPGAPRARPAEPDGVGAISERPAGVVGKREPAPIRVRLFGPAHVEAFGEEVKSGLRASAYELLAWYAEHPSGASIEAAADAIWPDASARRGHERFWTALGNLRSRLRSPSNPGVEILVKAGDCYRPDPAVLDIDLWDFEAALSDATRAADPAQAAAALQVAIDAYRGDFCPGVDAMWVEPVREDVHRRALDAHLRLAELYADDQPEAALGVLELAVEVDPICEEAHRRLVSLQVKLGRRDAAQRTWRLLQGRLAELDLEPEEATEQLVHELFPPRPTTTRHLPPTRN